MTKVCNNFNLQNCCRTKTCSALFNKLECSSDSSVEEECEKRILTHFFLTVEGEKG